MSELLSSGQNQPLGKASAAGTESHGTALPREAFLARIRVVSELKGVLVSPPLIKFANYSS